jgi:hypothetical protein
LARISAPSIREPKMTWRDSWCSWRGITAALYCARNTATDRCPKRPCDPTGLFMCNDSLKIVFRQPKPTGSGLEPNPGRCTPPDHRPGAGSSRTVAARAGRTVHRRDGELLKLGFELAQSSVAKYMVKRREPPNQGWRTFLRYTQFGRGHVLPFRRTKPLLIMTQLVWRATGRCAATAHHRP